MMDDQTSQNPEATEEDEQKAIDLVEAFSQRILKKRDEAVQGRAASGVERRWREDEMAYDGFDPVLTGNASMLDYATGDVYTRPKDGAKRSTVVVNVIRPKCETAVGRFSDIMQPVDSRNWGLAVTPVPDLMDGLKDDRPASEAIENPPPGMVGPDGQGLKVSDVAKSQIDEAKNKMKLMEAEIDDQLAECRYNGECREVQADAARIGTGIIKGPNVIKTLKKRWQQQTDETGVVFVLDQQEAMVPASVRVNPWNVYPDPNCGDDPKKMTYIWEYDEITPRELRQLIGVEGYLTSQIKRVFETDTKRTRVIYHDSGSAIVNKYTVDKGSTYERWEYYGDVDKEAIEALGCECDTDDQTVSACVVFVNDIPIKVALSALDTGELPYDFFQWSKVSGSIWGVGIPRESMWQARIIIAAFRAMMDNAGDSAGQNMVINRKLIQPADGRWELTGKKIWWLMEADADARAAMTQFQAGNIQDALQKIIELSLRFMDMETAVPMLFQGEKSGMPETLGATNIMVDSNNVALRSRAKRWDDQITAPHLARYYAWNMQYNPKNEIKGDYNVIPLGVSSLLQRDQQAQDIAQLFQLKQDPDVQLMTDWKKAIKALYSAKRLDILKSDEDVSTAEKQMHQQGPPQNPAAEVAQIRVQGELEKAKLVQESDMAELNFKADEAERQRKHEREMKTIDFQIKQMEYAEKRGINLDQIKADLAAASEKLNVQVALAGSKATGPQIVEPPVEPAGRASEGRAYPE